MKSKLVTIGLVQSKVSKNIEANLAKTEKMVRQAARRGAQIICLQELFQNVYFPQRRGEPKDKYAEPVPGRTSEAMRKLAMELGVVLIVPMYEKTKNGKYYNTALVFNEKGKMLGQYHKIHIPQDPGFYENHYFEPGQTGYKIFKTKFGTFAVLICYDQWYPEAAREVKLKGAEIIFYPTALGDIIGYKHTNDWLDAWETVQRGHAIANSIYVAAVNRVGREDRMRFFGRSFISDSFGKVLKKAGKDAEEVVIAKLDLAQNKFYSEVWGLMRNRRPDTYSTLIKDRMVQKSFRVTSVPYYKDTQKALSTPSSPAREGRFDRKKAKK